MSRKLWIALAVAVAVLAFGATVATAHRASFITSIIVTDADRPATNEIRIEGRLASPLRPCEQNRLVHLYAAEDKNGTPEDGFDDDFTFIDRDTTDERGHFVLRNTYPAASTDYFVVHAPRKVIEPSGHRHVCRADGEGVAEPPTGS